MRIGPKLDPAPAIHWIRFKGERRETAWAIDSGKVCVDSVSTGKWGCMYWYKKPAYLDTNLSRDSVIICNSKKKDCKFDGSESWDGDPKGLRN